MSAMCKKVVVQCPEVYIWLNKRDPEMFSDSISQSVDVVFPQCYRCRRTSVHLSGERQCIIDAEVG